MLVAIGYQEETSCKCTLQLLRQKDVHYLIVSVINSEDLFLKMNFTLCVGWADGTHIPVCRPGGGQQMRFYCGHHRVHCFKALGIMTPSGMLADFGPFDGKIMFVCK